MERDHSHQRGPRVDFRPFREWQFLLAIAATIALFLTAALIIFEATR
jgi:hypothetical protein